jgi:MoaA/NifB/PqqE/SkfB family radical SAM enzyme
MIMPFDEQLAKSLSLQFNLYPFRDYNDYAFGISNNMSLITQISYMAYNEPETFKSLKSYIEAYQEAGDSDQFMAAMGYCKYIERNFDDGIKYIAALLEYNPSNIDVWLDLCFFLAQATDGYYTHLNIRFHLYHFIHTYLKYDFHTINKKSLTILDRLVRNISRAPDVRSGYDKQVVLDTEYLFMNGACNNNCETCHVPGHLRGYDFEDRITKNGLIPLSKYIFIKVRKKHIRHLVLKGGEPTLHPEYLKIIKMASAVRRNILIHVRTNARTFSNSSFVKKHIASKVPNIIFEVGLFSDNPLIHDDITRVQNSHTQTVKGIENILDAGMKASVRIVLCDNNIDGLQNTLNFILKIFAGREGFGEIGILLPPPSADNLEKYYPDGIRLLRDRAADIIGGYKSEKCPISILNEALATDS